MFPTTKSPSVILYGSALPFPASAELVEIFSQFFIPQRGFSLSCAQCNAYLLYCARNKQPARGQGRSTYMFEAIVSQAHFAICLRERSGNILWYRAMFLLRSSGEGNILKCLSIT